jgi:purine-nucleoside/S-methyl-5'-thioadenosine phosphorylase / adenosine deaminase
MPPFIEPDWPAPARVKALSTTRQGGVSPAPYDSFNLGDHVGDAPAAVTTNRAKLLAALSPDTTIQWLEQVHGTDVIRAAAGSHSPQADASTCRQAGIACAVMTADCLPVLFCNRAGTVVAAAHAGWRGLLNGVLEATLDAMGEPPGELLAWLGPAIGPDAFEVGPEVHASFTELHPDAANCFRPSPTRGEHFLADIYALARQRLARLGLSSVYGGGYCTLSDQAHFFSYRRDGQTGRMASLIQLT